MDALYFTIKNFPDDVYYAVGKIIQASQEWEQDFKELVRMIHLCAPRGIFHAAHRVFRKKYMRLF